jgi:hypothetical protein
MPALSEVPTEIGYPINDADEHSTPRRNCYVDYIDPDKSDMAIRAVRRGDGTWEQTFNGRPAQFRSKNFQVTFSAEELADLGVSANGAGLDDPEGTIGPAGHSGSRLATESSEPVEVA